MPCPQGRMRKSLNDNQRTAQVSDSENDNQGKTRVSDSENDSENCAASTEKKKQNWPWSTLGTCSSTNTVTFDLFSLSYFDFQDLSRNPLTHIVTRQTFQLEDNNLFNKITFLMILLKPLLWWARAHMSWLLSCSVFLPVPYPAAGKKDTLLPTERQFQILPNQRVGAVTGQSGQKAHTTQKQQENAASEPSIRNHKAGIFLNQWREDTDKYWGNLCLQNT